MKEIFRDVIRQGMEVEMDEELGRERGQRTAGDATASNDRNGDSQKTIKTLLDELALQVPGECQGKYKPKTIGKYGCFSAPDAVPGIPMD